MIIDKVKPYWTDEEWQEREQIRKDIDDYYKYAVDKLGISLPVSEFDAEIKRLDDLAFKITYAVEGRYIASRTKEEVFKDAEEIVAAIEKEDFLEYLSFLKKLSIQKDLTAENFENCYRFILHHLRVQLNALLEWEKIFALAKNRAACWYIDQNATFFPTVHGKATDIIARMSSRGLATDPFTGDLSIDKDDVIMTIEAFNKLAGAIGIGAHKLLMAGLINFTANNNISKGEGYSGKINYEVSIPLKEYAKRCGYEVDPVISKKTTEAEASKEKKRAANALKDARKKISKNLEILANSSLTWKEKVKSTTKGKDGKEKIKYLDRDYVKVSIIGTRGIKDGYISMVFDPVFSKYLLMLPVTQYSAALWPIDERNSNAYNIGLKLCEHYNMDSNHIRKTAQTLKVQTILEYTNLPSIDTVREQHLSWQDRIKEPFEAALDTLTGGLLKDWKYCHAKGVDLTDDEASFKDFETWKETRLQFTLKDAPDHSARLQKKTERKIQQVRKKKAAASL